MPTEDVRTQVRNTLEDLLGVDGAAFLMDRPPGGWSDLATHRDIDALEARMDHRFTALEASFDTKIGASEDRLRGAMSDEFKAQTWRLIGAMTGLLAILVGAIKL